MFKHRIYHDSAMLRRGGIKVQGQTFFVFETFLNFENFSDVYDVKWVTVVLTFLYIVQLKRSVLATNDSQDARMH